MLTNGNAIASQYCTTDQTHQLLFSDTPALTTNANFSTQRFTRQARLIDGFLNSKI
jgi:hypothetical protein